LFEGITENAQIVLKSLWVVEPLSRKGAKSCWRV